MMDRRPLIASVLVLAAMFTPGFLTAASADVVYMDDLSLTLNGTMVFNDTFSRGLTLAGGNPPGTVLPSGTNFSDGSAGLYQVIGTVAESGNKARLDTAQGAHLVQSAPGFHHFARANIATLLTGPPTGPFSTPFSLTPSVAFSTTGLFDLTVPSTPDGFYQVNLSDRVASNMGLGDVIAMGVENCVAECKLHPGPTIILADANAVAGTTKTLFRVPLDTSNQEILLELSHPTAGTDTIYGSYAYVNGGITGPLTTFPVSYDGLFTGPGTVGYTQTGFVQLVAVVPEPSSLALLASSIPGVLGLVWFTRRKADGHRSKIGTRT
jgi:hypothetical protein